MAVRLKKRGSVEQWSVEIFELEELDESAQAEMNADPSAFIRELLGTEGVPVNGLMIDDKMLERSTGAGGSGPPPLPPLLAHVISPESRRSKMVTITVGAVDEGEVE